MKFQLASVFLAVVALSFAAPEQRGGVARLKRQFAPQVANSGATAVNNGDGGTANAVSNSQNNAPLGGFGLAGFPGGYGVPHAFGLAPAFLGQPQVANSGATAINNGAGGVANAQSGSTNNGALGK